MKLNDINVINRFVDRECLTEVVMWCDKVKELEEQEAPATIHISAYIFDYVITAIRALDKADYYDNMEWINDNINFKVK